MVCSKCEKKLARGVHQEMWKAGSRHTIESGGRVVNENKALTARKRWSPYGSGGGAGRRRGGKCRVCKQSLHQEGIYCQKCAYAQGQCSMCGVKVWDTTYHNVGGIRAPPEGGAAGVADASDDADDAEEPGASANEPAARSDEADPEAEAKAKAEAEAEAARRRDDDAAAAAAAAANRLSGPTSLANAAREMATASTGATVTGWQYDAASGYYFDTDAQMYYDPKSKKYFDCRKNAWLESEKPTGGGDGDGDQERHVRQGDEETGSVRVVIETRDRVECAVIHFASAPPAPPRTNPPPPRSRRASYSNQQFTTSHCTHCSTSSPTISTASSAFFASKPIDCSAASVAGSASFSFSPLGFFLPLAAEAGAAFFAFFAPPRILSSPSPPASP